MSRQSGIASPWNQGRVAADVQPWSQVMTLAEAGKGCDGLFDLYDSLGDQTLVGAHTIPTLLDGPERVVRYDDLVIGDGTTASSLTAANRCKGLTVICNNLTVKNNATLHMTGRGARVLISDDPSFPFIDYKIPFRIALASSRMSLAQALAVIKSQGLAPWDAGTFQHVIASMYGFDLSISLAGAAVLMSVLGCGAGGAGQYGSGNVNGAAGAAGTNGGMGGGGAGGVNGTIGSSYGLQGGFGCPYSGGSGQGGLCHASSGVTNMPLQSKYSGKGGKGGGGLWSIQPSGHIEDAGNPLNATYPSGGGAGNPGGPGQGGGSAAGSDGTGGKLTIICRGTVTVQSGGKIEANGMPGGAGPTYGGGGGSGGGHISLISPAAVSNAGTIQCAGGAGGSGGGSGGNGGAGSVVTKTFSDMGW